MRLTRVPHWYVILTMANGLITMISCIQHGTTLTDGSLYPFYVMLGNPHVCGGTILNLNPPKILTAAHCVLGSPHPSTFIKNNQKIPYFVGYGHIERQQQRMMSVVDWVIHPNYDTSNDNGDHHSQQQQPANLPQQYDVAILTLSSPLLPSRYVAKASIWSPSLYPHQDANQRHVEGALIGYGYKASNESESTTLQRMTLEVDDYQPLSNNMINAVATFDQENRMACHGDSGSPLIVDMPYNLSSLSTSFEVSTYDMKAVDIQPFIIGTLARIFGVRDADPDHPTCPTKIHTDSIIVESFVNLVPLLPWISQQTNQSIDQLVTPSSLVPFSSTAPSPSSTYIPPEYDEDTNGADDWNTAATRNRHSKGNVFSSWYIGRLFFFNTSPFTDSDDFMVSTSSLGIGHAILPNIVSSSSRLALSTSSAASLILLSPFSLLTLNLYCIFVASVLFP